MSENTINNFLNIIPNSELVSHEESIKHTPVSDCEWKTFLGTEGERGISRCYPTDKERIEILKKYGTDYIKYDIHGNPDFSKFAETQVKISNMTDSRNINFPSADKKLVGTQWAKERGLNTTSDIAKYRSEHKLTWHEMRDGTTLQLVPTEIHEKFPHLGGKAIMSRLINSEGLSAGAVKIKFNQATVKFEENVNDIVSEQINFINEATKIHISQNIKEIHQSGLDRAQDEALFAAVLTVTKNTVSVCKGEKNIKDASKDALTDVASAYVMGYAKGAVAETFGFKYGQELFLVEGAVRITKQIVAYANNEITEEQLINGIAETSVLMCAKFIGKNMGRIVGNKLLPGVGGDIGAYIGEMITTAICSEVISTIKATKEFEKQNQKYIALYHRAESEIKASNERLTAIIEAENNELRAIIQKGFEDIYIGINGNSYDSIMKGLATIGSKFGVTEDDLKKDLVSKDNIFKNTEKVLVIGEGI